ncbi:MAG TPA: SDR family NAD(P)-dependent oxidoreductase, partial [Candidatus Dormibacteraeota bacterium]|nr:SDR family NAD(P)-dependent oxidoreductase [Candidatus Dormibacteraeota bacterium]
MTSSESSYRPPNLKGRVALVAGATRGTGRGIALAFGEAGATVYCTGRSSRATRHLKSSRKTSPFELSTRPETVEETAEMVTARGGEGIAVIVDHLESEQVEKLVTRIRKEQKALHILVNDIWGGDQHVEFGKTIWQVDLHKGFAMLQSAVHTHIITSHFALPLMIETVKENGTGLVVEITDGDSYTYRGNLFYDLVKTTVIRFAFAQARELRRKNIAAVALTPGFLRSEAMLEHFGVTEANWREAGKKDANFLGSETPLFSGR